MPHRDREQHLLLELFKRTRPPDATIEIDPQPRRAARDRERSRIGQASARLAAEAPEKTLNCRLHGNRDAPARERQIPREGAEPAVPPLLGVCTTSGQRTSTRERSAPPTGLRGARRCGRLGTDDGGCFTCWLLGTHSKTFQRTERTHHALLTMIRLIDCTSPLAHTRARHHTPTLAER